MYQVTSTVRDHLADVQWVLCCSGVHGAMNSVDEIVVLTFPMPCCEIQENSRLISKILPVFWICKKSIRSFHLGSHYKTELPSTQTRNVFHFRPADTCGRGPNRANGQYI